MGEISSLSVKIAAALLLYDLLNAM